MNNAYVELAVSFSNNQWQLERKWFSIIFSDAFTARAAVVSRLRGELRCQRGDVGRRSSCLLDLLAEAAPNFPHELGGRLERAR